MKTKKVTRNPVMKKTRRKKKWRTVTARFDFFTLRICEVDEHSFEWLKKVMLWLPSQQAAALSNSFLDVYNQVVTRVRKTMNIVCNARPMSGPVLQVVF